MHENEAARNNDRAYLQEREINICYWIAYCIDSNGSISYSMRKYDCFLA